MLTASGEELMDVLDLEDAPQLSPRHNISPTQATLGQNFEAMDPLECPQGVLPF